VLDDDEILEAYERELSGSRHGAAPERRSNRGFWMVAGAIALGSVVLVVAIFANRPMLNAISRTEHDLNVALSAARRIYAEGGTFTAAGAAGLAKADRGRTYVNADRPASAPGIVSVYASIDTWAAASRTQQGTCFYIKQVASRDTTYLVADGDCTGTEALAADQSEW